MVIPISKNANGHSKEDANGYSKEDANGYPNIKKKWLF